MKVYGLPEGQGLDRRNDKAHAAGEGLIIPAVQDTRNLYDGIYSSHLRIR